MAYSKRKILFSGLLGIVSVGTVALPSFAATEPSSIHKMSRSMLHEQIGKAIAADDYEAFTAIIAKKNIGVTISRNQFEALVKARTLRLAGNYSEAQATLKAAGITRASLHHTKYTKK